MNGRIKITKIVNGPEVVTIGRRRKDVRKKITKMVAMLPLIVQKHVQTWISVHANNKYQQAYNEG